MVEYIEKSNELKKLRQEYMEWALNNIQQWFPNAYIDDNCIFAKEHSIVVDFEFDEIDNSFKECYHNKDFKAEDIFEEIGENLTELKFKDFKLSRKSNMIFDDLKNRLLDNPIAINCKTLEEAKLFLKTLSDWGVFTKVDSSWFAHKEETCYQIHFDKLAMDYLKIYENIKKYNQNFYEIWSFEKFMEEYFKETPKLYENNRNIDVVDKMCEIDLMNIAPIEYLLNCLKSEN